MQPICSLAKQTLRTRPGIVTAPDLPGMAGGPKPLRQTQILSPQKRHPSQDVFVCNEESDFYSRCLEQLLVARQSACAYNVIEFGSGDGSPVLNCLMRSGDRFQGTISAFEINPAAAQLAQSKAKQLRLDDVYQVHNGCFFEGARRLGAECLIANPPYIAAPDDDIMMPELFGGTDGSTLTRELLSLGFSEAMLLISAYSNPAAVLEHALQEGYVVKDFEIIQLPFGAYSSEPKVRSWLAQMKASGQAFYGEHGYLLAGVLFCKLDAGCPAAAQLRPFLQSEDDSMASSCPSSSSQPSSPIGSVFASTCSSPTLAAAFAGPADPALDAPSSVSSGASIDRGPELLAALMAPL